MYKLIIEDDEGKTTVVPLIRDEITIGRKEGNTIRLTERNVSRKHAKLAKTNGTIYIEDLSSYNGIKVNGDRISGRAPVNEGDRIQIGDYQLALKMDKAAQPGAVTDEKTTPFIKDGASPTAMLDMTPTVQNPVVSSELPARLVVVSSNFAGQEFVLDKAAVVIGRTDENDIVVNHRSISRHHAKVVRENGHYHIVDLQSANGVRVNGEEYGKVELRKGDHVDLGHVRLRFVSPGEDFVFDRDAQIVDVAGAKKSRTGLVVGGLFAVLLIGGGVIAVTKLGGKTEGGPKPETAGQVAMLLLETDKALKAEQWDEAVAKADEALKLDPNQEIAREKKQKAEAERKSKGSYGGFSKSFDAADWDSAMASWGEISEDSIYRQKGAEKYAQAKKAYLREHLDKARKAKAQSKCDEARQHVEAVLTVDEGNADAAEIGRTCGQKPPTPPTVATNKPERPSRPSRPSRPEPTESTDTPPPPSAPSGAAAEKQLQEAQDDYVHGQYQSAIEKARKAVKAAPNRAWRIIGASSCFLKDKGGASSAWNRLDATGRSFLKYVCARSGITVP